jgi:hypothetical protein
MTLEPDDNSRRLVLSTPGVNGLADRREWTLSCETALATVAVLARDSRCDQGHDAVNREIVLRLTS